MRRNIQLYIPVLLVFFLFLDSKCSNKYEKNKISSDKYEELKDVVKIMSPSNGEMFILGDEIDLNLFVTNEIVDSIIIIFNNKNKTSFSKDYTNLSVNTKNGKTGNNIIKLMVYRSDNQQETHSVNVLLKGDVKPIKYNYRVINSFPHDQLAYTQGLIYEDGYLLESTGQTGKSDLRKVELKSGKVLLKTELSASLFGEGIALIGDSIFQVTYKSQKGFVYDRKTLSEILTFSYNIGEGWGLTSCNNKLFMSDGSNVIYIYEKEYFTQTDQLEVYDNNGKVKNLNELEYINDKIFANIYGSTIIVIIEASTGKIIGEIDLSKIMPKEFYGDMDKVLNGIAYNPQNNHLFVTGKFWPELFEIEIIDFF